MKRICVIALCLAPSVAAGQQAYRPPSDTLFYLIINPYRMYWVSGGDTLSQPNRSVTVESQSWARKAPNLHVIVRHQDLDVTRRVKQDTFVVAPQGNVETINGHAPGLNERRDLLPRLPKRPLTLALSWSDTLHSAQAGGPGGGHTFTVIRTWRVARLFDSAGTRLAELSASGDVHYQDGWWADSAAGSYAAIDVRGPVNEHALLSITAGQLVERSWSMNLTGRGSHPSAVGVDTLPAGLISAESQRWIPRDRAHLLTRPLLGADTSMSYNTGPILLHVVDRHPAEISAAMTRNDGMVGTTHVSYDSGRVRSYEALWTDTSSSKQITLQRVGDSLVIREAGRPDTSVAIPTRWWGVADYAMNELLVPSLLTTGEGQSDTFAVYRPYPGHWDVGIAGLRRVGEHFVASYKLGTDTISTFLLITSAGDLLFAENSGPTGAQRAPLPGTARRAQLEEILRALQRQ